MYTRSRQGTRVGDRNRAKRNEKKKKKFEVKNLDRNGIKEFE